MGYVESEVNEVQVEEGRSDFSTLLVNVGEEEREDNLYPEGSTVAPPQVGQDGSPWLWSNFPTLMLGKQGTQRGSDLPKVIQ